MASLTVLEQSVNLALPAATPAGLYVHVPFCFHKCHYCDFYSITRQSPDRMGRFVDLVLREADVWRDSPVTPRPNTVFFGGGTPSLLPHDDMRRLLEGLRERIELGSVREWTVEVNPATADLAYLRMLRAGGVDRLSFGAQSFDAGDLAMLERQHDPADVPRAVALAREAGFERVSLDLIFAVPGQTLDGWRRNLDTALELRTTHLSCYGLTYEPNTPLAVRRRLGRVEAAAESLELEMFAETRRCLREAGLPPYEVSNYAKAGEESLHNLGYWRGEGYVGLGPSAASHVEGVRFRNEPHLGRWEAAVEGGTLAAVEVERLSGEQREGELAWLNLRLAGGIEVADFVTRTGVDPRRRFSGALVDAGSSGLVEDTGTHLRITERGWHLADGIGALFI